MGQIHTTWLGFLPEAVSLPECGRRTGKEPVDPSPGSLQAERRVTRPPDESAPSLSKVLAAPSSAPRRIISIFIAGDNSKRGLLRGWTEKLACTCMAAGRNK